MPAAQIMSVNSYAIAGRPTLACGLLVRSLFEPWAELLDDMDWLSFREGCEGCLPVPFILAVQFGVSWSFLGQGDVRESGWDIEKKRTGRCEPPQPSRVGRVSSTWK